LIDKLTSDRTVNKNLNSFRLKTMTNINNCIICGSVDFKDQFKKKSATGEEYILAECKSCGLKFLPAPPDENKIAAYYKKDYFTNRTERGYDNYFSRTLKNEIERVFKLNLADLDFFNFERKLNKPKSLDIGCAAGYFVNYLKDRGWASEGVDISEDCVNFAVKCGLNVYRNDYLRLDFNLKFNLITMWASIEHLHRPELFLKKIHEDLADEGRLFISTCRADGFNFMKFFGPKWRFYNFPEHIFFFSHRTIKKILEKSGFRILRYRTYGSNIGKPGSLIRKAADFCAKKFYSGDMMIISAEKI
jgi:SAM-dependent methyltransferase